MYSSFTAEFGIWAVENEKLFALPQWRSDMVLLVICTNRKQPRIKTKVESMITPATSGGARNLG